MFPFCISGCISTFFELLTWKNIWQFWTAFIWHCKRETKRTKCRGKLRVWAGGRCVQAALSVLTDAGNEVVEPVLWKQRVLQTPEVQLQHPGHRVDVVVALLVYERVVTWATSKSGVIAWQFYSLPVMWPSDLTGDLSPLSKQFLMSLTSTCEPETRKMPWCWRPEKNIWVWLQAALHM